MNRRTFASGSAAFGVVAALVVVHSGAAFKGGKPVQSDNRGAVRHPGYMDATGGIAPYIPEGAPRMLAARSEEHTSELQSLMRSSYAVFCLKKKKTQH